MNNNYNGGYNNPYMNNYGYGNYPYGSGQYQQPQQSMQQNLNNYNNYQNNNNVATRAKCEIFSVNSFEEVKNHITNPNTTFIYKDVNNKIMYEKKTDSQGISEIKAYQEIMLNSNNEYVRRNELGDLEMRLNEKINNLSNMFQNANVGQKTKQKSNINDNVGE